MLAKHDNLRTILGFEWIGGLCLCEGLLWWVLIAAAAAGRGLGRLWTAYPPLPFADYGDMQFPAYRQQMAGIDFPQTGGRYSIRLDELRKILKVRVDSGAGCFPLEHPDSKLPRRSDYFEDQFLFCDDVLHQL